MGKFEERLWSIVRNFVRVAQEDPGLLVTALQVGACRALLVVWGPACLCAPMPQSAAA